MRADTVPPPATFKMVFKSVVASAAPAGDADAALDAGAVPDAGAAREAGAE